MICCHIVQALLELQRQQDSMRLSSTRGPHAEGQLLAHPSPTSGGD